MIKTIKNLIPTKVKYRLVYYLSSRSDNYFESLKKQKKVVVTLAADYGNLGDIAITYAQTEFLKKTYPDYAIIELPISKTFTKLKALKHACNRDDIITIIGGGNMGDLYDEIEFARQFVIKHFPRNKIISFPQTIDFSATPNGAKMLRRTVKVYSKHNNLTLIAREKLSYELMKKNFPKNTVLITPDIVLSLDKSEPALKRQDITFSLRNDKEKLINLDQQQKIIEKIRRKYHYATIKFCDTYMPKANMPLQERMNEFEKILYSFKTSSLVITDRLHAMIFCYITKTPCIVFPNNNHKIEGVYNWISSCGYIRLCKEYDDIETILNNMEEMLKIKTESVTRTNLEPYFKCICTE